MKLYLILFLVILFLSSLPVFAQEESLTKLPTIVIRGKDRSYLEIVRVEKLPFMSYRGEKKKAKVIYKVKLPLREEFIPEFPLLSIPVAEKVSVSPKIKEKVRPFSFTLPTLSRTYIKEKGIAFSLPVAKRKIPLIKEIRVKKELIHPPVKVVSLPKEIYFSTAFPSLPVKPAKIITKPPKKEVLAYLPPFTTLSRSYIREEKVEIPPAPVKANLPLPRKRISQKKILQPGIVFTPPLPPQKESYSTHFVGIPKTIKIIKAEKKGRLPPLSISYPVLSRRYIKEKKISLPINLRERKIRSLRERLERKKVFEPPFYARLPEKSKIKLSFPKIGVKLPELYPVAKERKIPARVYLASLKQFYIKDTPTWPKEKKIPLKLEVAETKKERKKLIHPPLSIPSITRVYFPERIEKSKYPYLHLLIGTGSYNSFNYQLDYGREREKRRYLLSLQREYSPKWMIYSSSQLEREDDILSGKIIWDNAGLNKTWVSIQGHNKITTLPQKGKRTDTLLSLGGEIGIFENWRANLWGEKTTRVDKNAIDEKWNNLNYGVGLTLQSENFPLSVEGTVNWNNLTKNNTSSNNTYQTLVQIKSTHPFYLGKNIFSQIKVGIRGVKNERKAQLVGDLKLTWKAKENVRGVLSIDRKFHLLKFSDIYLPQAYSEAKLNLNPVDVTNYNLDINYFNFPWIELGLRWFSKRGKDLVWVYDTSEHRLIPEIVKFSRQGWRLTGSWHISPSLTLEPTYTWQNIKNEQTPDKAIPHIPQSWGKLLLKIKVGDWLLETSGEWIGERYYTLEKKDILPSASKMGLRINYLQKEWEAFLEIENNDNYFLSKDYQFLEDKVTFGIKFKLF